MPSERDFLTESFLLQAPDQLIADEQLFKRLGKMKSDSARTRSQIESLGGERAKFRGLAERFETDVGNIGPEQRALRRSASTIAARAPREASTAGGSLSEALRRAKVRAGITQRGDAAIRGQRLKDRLGLVRSDLTRRASALDLSGAGQQIRAGVRINAQRARDEISSARSGAVGAGLGAAAGALKRNKDENDSFFDFGAKG